MNKAFENILESFDEIKGCACDGRSCSECEYTYDCFEGEMSENVAIDKAKEIVQAVAEEYDWIPCSERLPTVEVDVLLTLRNLDIYTGFRANTEGYFYVDGVEGKYVPFDNVMAWQALPFPYLEKH